MNAPIPLPAELAGAIAHLTTWSEVSAKMEGDHPSVLVTSIRTVLDRLRLADELAKSAEPFEQVAASLVDNRICISVNGGGVDVDIPLVCAGDFRTLASKLSAFRGGAK